MTVTVRIISILTVITIGPSLAYGSPACMTESEARAKFPKAHLVWVGTNHCWTFGAVPVHSRRPILAAGQSRCLPDNPYRRKSLPGDPSCNVNIRHVSSRSSELPGASDDANGQQLVALSGQAADAR